MTNGGVLAVYIPLALMGLAVVALSLWTGRGKKSTAYLLMAAFSVFAWALAKILFYGTTGERAALYLYDLDLPFVALTALSVFLLAIRFYRLDNYLSTTLIIILALPCAATFTVACLVEHTDIMRTLTVIQTKPIHIVESVRGPWFWIHAVYCYILMIATIVLTVVQHARLPKKNRAPSYLLIASILCSALGNIIVLTGVSPYIDFALVGAAVSVLMLYFALRRNQGMSLLKNARHKVFNLLHEGILIVNDSGRIINANDSARKWMCGIGLDPGEESYGKTIVALRELSRNAVELTDWDFGKDFYVRQGDEEFVYNLREKPITNRVRRRIGTIVMVSDVTANRALISRLENEAGMDPLTGILNRRSVDYILADLDTPENLPLAIIAADVNDLKETNDRLGHSQGDVLLRVAAELIASACPSYARLGRTGGDEFAVILPRSHLKRADDVIRDIREAAAKQTNYPFRISLAMGAAVKNNPDTDIADVVKLADKRMYNDKARCKENE